MATLALRQSVGLLGVRVRKLPLLSTLILVVLLLDAILAPVIAPHDPTEGALAAKLRPPAWETGGSAENLLGTDRFGRDILSRVVYGGRVSLIISLLAILAGGAVGVALGLLSGYFGGWVDALIMRLVDLALSLPMVLLCVIVAFILGPSFGNIILIIALVLWARYARQIRAEVLTIRERDFVALAKVAGCSPLYIMAVHIFPNVLNTVIVLSTLQVGWVILLEATLSFLGVGIPPPTAAWGLMVAEGRQFIVSAWWISFFPGLAILLTCLAFNLFGDWLRDRLDPKLRQV
ncbi:MAG: ABC transporter permease [Chloroflexi bacterium]|nr:ABC transporter permease [Chloroflexota bacterium]